MQPSELADLPRFSTERPAKSESVAEPGQSGQGAATLERFSRVKGERRFGVAAGGTHDGSVSKIGACIQHCFMVPSECPEKGM